MRRSLLPLFGLWLALFYGGWATLVAVLDLGDELRAHWPIALAMALGSYFAGSTPMGGGTIGFPVLVLLFDQPASLGRDFSFAVQSIGMTSASILILCRRQRIDWPQLRWALLGVVVGVPLGLATVAPHVPSLAVKLLFAVLWASFGVLHLLRMREIMSFHHVDPTAPRLAAGLAFTIGLAGGATVTAVTGVGVDMLIYVAMVQVFRQDLKVAIPTSVILMAAASLVGIVARNLFGLLDPARAVPVEVFYHWLAAAPVVALGAPFGAVVVALLSRSFTLRLVSVLCVGQLVWTLWDQRDLLGPASLTATAAGLVGFMAVFAALHEWGVRLERRSTRASDEMPPGFELLSPPL